MLSQEQNDRLTRVGAGTPGGELLRRYWHPIAAASELDENPVKKVRLLGEDLVLYRDRSGNLGLIDEPCPHRRVSMEYGIPEEEGLRCPYHGWRFNHEGKCLEQPAEPWNSTFKDRITTNAYPVQELGGLMFAYLGPQPAPLLPRYDLYVWDNVIRQIGLTILPCNWLQCVENSMDPVHVEWLHSYYLDYAAQRRGGKLNAATSRARHKKIGFDRFEHGLIKRRVLEGNTEEDDPWKVGHPVVFPYMLRAGANGFYTYQIRVPMDDTHTYHVNYVVYRPGIPLPPQQSIPTYEIPLYDEQGKFITDVVLVQDFFAWASQGPIARRDLEHLAQSDAGVIMFRQLLEEQIQRVERDEDPMCVYRNPEHNQCIDLPGERDSQVDARLVRRQSEMLTGDNLLQGEQRYRPDIEQVRALFLEAEVRAAAGEPLLPPVQPPLVPIGANHHRQVLIRP